MKKGILLLTLLTIIITNSLLSQSTINVYWDGGAGDGLWKSKENWDNDVLPRANDDAIINIADNITLDSTLVIESLAISSGASLTISSGFTLTTTKGGNVGSDAVRLTGSSGTESSLIVNGSLIINDAPGDGIDINDYTSVTVGTTGSITIPNASGDAIETSDDLINNGTITITNPTANGIGFSSVVPGGASITNSSTGTINITGGDYGIELNGDLHFDNDGSVIISGTTNKAFKGSGDGNFYNNGTFDGVGIVDAANFVGGGLGSTISPGTSPGQLTFDDDIDFSNSSFEIEINGVTTAGTDYDQIVTLGSTDITGVNLNLSGSYSPVVTDNFTILNNTSGNDITGTFNGLSEGTILVFNGANMAISYVGGTGNDIILTFQSLLPVELIGFNASVLSDQVQLNWATATETNNDFFTIERSTDGRTFEAIETIAGNGNSTEFIEYAYLDRNPENGVSYYRLKQTDYDRQFSYSEIKSVKIGNDQSIKVYPTLVNEKINIETSAGFEGNLNVIVRDMHGRVYKQLTIPRKENNINLELGDLVPGSYFITIQNNESIQTYKIIKL